MRWVTANPPNMLIVVSTIPTTASQRIHSLGGSPLLPSGGAICTRAPIAMMLLMALVTLISGVCSAGVTFQTTMYPTKQASTNTVKWARKAAGAWAPTNQNSAAATPNMIASLLPAIGSLAAP